MKTKKISFKSYNPISHLGHYAHPKGGGIKIGKATSVVKRTTRKTKVK